jgi:hypothetical protein
MIGSSILEQCQQAACATWLCQITRYPDAITVIAAILGLVLIGMTIVRFRTAPVADVGAGLAGMLAVGVLLLSLPVISKVSLSFAKDQSVALEFKSTASAENVCTINNIVTEINKPLNDRINELAQRLEGIRVQASANGNAVASDDGSGNGGTDAAAPVRSKADVRIYYRSGRTRDAETLRQALAAKFLSVDAINTDLTEVGQDRDAGFNRVRFEATANELWMDDAATVKDMVASTFRAVVSGPDSVERPLPGDIQVLLY